MDSAQQIYINKLKSAKYSNTKARSIVFEVLLASEHKPITMSELVKKVGAKADRASVYRSVELLENLGIVKRLHLGWKYKLELSDDFHGHHHHISCLKCGMTHVTHDDEWFESQLKELATKHGYIMTEHQIEIKGICKNCS